MRADESHPLPPSSLSLPAACGNPCRHRKAVEGIRSAPPGGPAHGVSVGRRLAESRLGARVRAKHAFGVAGNPAGLGNTRYGDSAKNGARMFSLFGSAGFCTARKKLPELQGRRVSPEIRETVRKRFWENSRRYNLQTGVSSLCRFHPWRVPPFRRVGGVTLLFYSRIRHTPAFLPPPPCAYAG